ncbi:hypothetical protein H7T43_24065 [Peribacillus simplex]|uniref:hypothetical protein n=1 Tax=Peribacillus simplex TaxID=1478 RepID=UPI002989D1D2|nr:hypothetical protein [Peribacillus simplex]MBX9957938.1 hypothetical protein [Peribacillus simplex]
MFKKLSLIFLLLSILIISGCVKSSESKEKQEVGTTNNYEGASLKIGVVGNEDKLPKFSNVSYQKRELNDLVNNQEENFDALIITNEAFSEADKDQFVEYFNKVKYPVFFYEAKGISDDAFLEKGVTLESSKINSSAYIRGYVNKEKERVKWVLHLPDNKNKSDKENIFIQLFEIIDENKR